MGCSVIGITNEKSLPIAVMSETEIRQRQTKMTSFANRYHEAWPDIDQTFADFAEDATFSDPSSGDFLVEGKDRILSLNRTFARYASDMETETTGVYLSADGAAFSVLWVNLWPPWVAEPSDHPPLSGLELFEFEDELVSRQAIMYLKETSEMIELGCFAEDVCDELGAYVDQYLTAWSSRDERQVASLYAPDAVFSDSLLDMEEEGSPEIGDLAGKRFGSAGDITLELIGLYVQTKGFNPPTELLPEVGRILGIGIHYRLVAVDDEVSMKVESITTFTLNPEGFITNEEVFHDVDSLVEAGLVR